VSRSETNNEYSVWGCLTPILRYPVKEHVEQ
jgi:hypothetical protein